MKLKLLFILLCFINYANLSGQCKLDYSNYHLILDEQFNTTLTDLKTRWSFNTGDPNWIGATGGIEYFDSGQVSLLSGGILRLKATQITPTVITTPNGNTRLCKYKSGMIRSTMIVDGGGWSENGFKYGIFEMRAKLPAGRTTGDNSWDAWPTFWLTSAITEIDIIDAIEPDPSRSWHSGMIDWSKFPNGNPTDWDLFYDCSYPDPVCGSPNFASEVSYPAYTLVKYDGIVYKSNKAIKPCSVAIFGQKRLQDLSSTFNTYTAVWTPDKVTFFLNGVELYTISSSKIKTEPYPARIVASLQMLAGGIDPEYNMDIDYIRVWKPNNDDYALPYKSTNEYMNHDVNASSSYWNFLPDENSIAIATNPNNPNEIFYRNQNNQISVVTKGSTSSTWNPAFQIPYNDGATVTAIGDVKYLPSKDMLLYIGNDNKINFFGRSTVEPSGFYHWYLTSNYYCPTCPVGENISTQPGSLQTAPNDEVFYRGLDNKMHRYYSANGVWNHQLLPSAYPNEELVSGNISVESPNNTVYYRGNDGRLQCFYKSGSNYVHTWIDNDWNNTDALIKSRPGSLVVAPALSGVLYIGADNKIHLFYFNLTWHHMAIPYTYGTPAPSGYTNADLAFNSLVWDNQALILYYTGFDGRIQYFQKSGSQWNHFWLDDHWNTDEFASWSTDMLPLKYSSTVQGPLGIYYTRRDNHLAYFKWEPCEILNPDHGYSPNITSSINPLENTKSPSKFVEDGYNTFGVKNEQSNIPSKKQDNVFSISPNPSRDGIFYIDRNSVSTSRIEVFDFMGKRILQQQITGIHSMINLSSFANGVYFVTIQNGHQLLKRKIVKQ